MLYELNESILTPEVKEQHKTNDTNKTTAIIIASYIIKALFCLKLP
jgi:hypothetical protein